ncbi:Alpha-L-arabinofuranosidase C, partial [Frankliniella fusca]
SGNVCGPPLSASTSLGDNVEAEGMSADGESSGDELETCFNVSTEQEAGLESDDESLHSLGSDTSNAGPGQSDDMHHWDSAQFLLYLREEAMISQSALNKAVDGVDELFSKVSNSIKDRILEGIDASGSVSEDHIKKTFGEFSSGMFSGVDSKETLQSFAKEHLEVLEPEEVELYTTEEWRDGKIHTVQHKAYLSPFLPSLKRLLTRPDVLSCVENPAELQEEGVYRSFRDGKHTKEHPILSKEGSVGVICAFDELEVSSPLGPKKHKLALYYWTLANFSPHMRASLKSVQLMAIAWSKDLKDTSKTLSQSVSLDLKYERHKKIFSPFLEDIRKLEKGIQIVVNGTPKTITGTLLCVCGDTPAVNVLGGFKESVGIAHKPCHKCEADHNEAKRIFHEEAFQKRTPERLNLQLQELNNSRTLKNRQEKSTLYGINGPPVFSDIIGLCPVQSYCYDLLHVLHEGVLEAHCRVLLKYAVGKALLTLEEINADVRLMSCQLFSKDRPAAMLPGHLDSGLRQSAAQMLSLALCLPFTLVKKSETNAALKERLLNFARLLQISMGLLAYELTSQHLVQLRRMIQIHHETFTVHYPEFDITPKFHYLIHIPSQIENFGPSRVTWCFRFEAMHSYIKNIIRITKNFINPPLSISKRYESLRASQMLVRPRQQPQNFIEKDDVHTWLREVKVGEHRHKNLLCQVFDQQEKIQSCKSIKTKGSVFCINSIVLLDNQPSFGKVIEILFHDDMKILIVAVLKTVKYEILCNAYYLHDSDPPEAVKMYFLENLEHFHPFISMSVHADHQNLWVIPKYHKIGFNHP